MEDKSRSKPASNKPVLTGSSSVDNADHEDVIMTMGFKPAPFVSPYMIIAFYTIAGGITGVSVGAFNSGRLDSTLLLIETGVLLGTVAALCLIRFLTWKKTIPGILLTKSHIVLPKNHLSTKTCTIAYEDINTLDIRGKAKKQVLVIGTGAKNFLYPLKAFESNSENLLTSFKDAFQESITGRTCWQYLEEKQDITDTFMRVRPVATYTLTAIIILGFVIEVMLGAGGNTLELIGLGANMPMLVAEGEWSRLFVANFLHAGLIHLYFNALALIILGAMLERMIGIPKLIILFLLSSLGGAVSSSVFSSSLLSVGASTGIFGLLGALAISSIKHQNRLPVGFLYGWRLLIFILVLNVALPFFIPQIDWAAHLGGFITGAIVMGVYTYSKEKNEQDVRTMLANWRSSSLVLNLSAVILGGIFSMAIADTALKYKSRENTLEQIIGNYLSQGEMPNALANSIAWETVIDEESSNESLALARELMEPVISKIQSGSNLRENAQASYLDTFASIEYLQGNYHEAVVLEYQALIKNSSKRFYFSQFSRFLGARNALNGPLELGNVDFDDFQLQFENNPASNMTRVVVASNPASPRPVNVITHVYAGNTRKGLIICHLVNINEATLIEEDKIFNIPVNNLNFVMEMLDVDNGTNPRTSDECSRPIPVDGLAEIQPETGFSRLL